MKGRTIIGLLWLGQFIGMLLIAVGLSIIGVKLHIQAEKLYNNPMPLEEVLNERINSMLDNKYIGEIGEAIVYELDEKYCEERDGLESKSYAIIVALSDREDYYLYNAYYVKKRGKNWLADRAYYEIVDDELILL